MSIEKRLEKLEERVNPRGKYNVFNVRFWDESLVRVVFKGGKYLGQVNFKAGEVEAVHGDVPMEFQELGGAG